MRDKYDIRMRIKIYDVKDIEKKKKLIFKNGEVISMWYDFSFFTMRE